MKYLMSKAWLEYEQLMKERPEDFMQYEQMQIEKNPEIIREYVEKTGRVIGVMYRSPYSILVTDLICSTEGGYYVYERILPAVKKGAVVSVPVYKGRFVLLRQFRHALRDYQYSFPRGFGELGLSSEENAAKELKEEVGANVLDTQYLGTVVADSGLCGNQVQVFECQIDRIELKYGYEGIEQMIQLDEDEMKQWIKAGKITDGFTLAAYSLYCVNHMMESED